MALSDNKRLYDIATRLALYVEGVKVQQAKQFNFVLRDINEVLRKLLGRVNYKTLDGLSKAQLNRLILDLRQSQSKIYSDYTKQLLEQLQDFMNASLEVNRRVWVTAKLELESEDDEEVETVSDEQAVSLLVGGLGKAAVPLFGLAAITGANDRLFSTINNTPLAANGLYLQTFLKTFAISAQSGVENIIRKGYANRLSVDEVLTELVGDGTVRQGAGSQLVRIGTQANAVIHTSTAHVEAIVSAGVLSALFDLYAWHSVMDSNTTEICQSRNLRIYRFGNGPIPPAHIRCRSHVAPVEGS